MNKIGEITKQTEKRIYFILIGFIFNIFFAVLIHKITAIDIFEQINNLSLIEILPLPIVVLGTTVLHEYIHVLFFNLFSKGRAAVRPTWEKSLGAIVLRQTNPNVSYGKLSTVIILLSPLVVLTVASCILAALVEFKLLVFINCVLNSIGSSTDLYISTKLIFKYPNNIKIIHKTGELSGIEIYKQH